LIFDIGFNVGAFSRACFEKYPGCTVVGVEANRTLLFGAKALLRRAIFKLKRRRLILLHSLVSSESGGTLPFYISDISSGLSSASTKHIQDSRFTLGNKFLIGDARRWNRVVAVNTVTLDDLISKFGTPDLIKVDVEGFEFEVLTGLSSSVPILCFEWHEESLGEALKCLEHLKSIGYRKYGVVGYFEDPSDECSKLFTNIGSAAGHLDFPENYYSIEDFILSNFCNEQRRVNWGMIYVKT